MAVISDRQLVLWVLCIKDMSRSTEVGGAAMPAPTENKPILDHDFNLSISSTKHRTYTHNR